MVLYSTVLCSTVQYSAVQYSTVPYSTVLCSTVQCRTVRYLCSIFAPPRLRVARPPRNLQLMVVKNTDYWRVMLRIQIIGEL